jgi:hypothetical protein
MRIVAYQLAWNFKTSVGAVRLRGEDGHVWPSGAIDAASFAAIAAVLKEGASANNGILFSGNETANFASTEGTMKPLGEGSPFPW